MDIPTGSRIKAKAQKPKWRRFLPLYAMMAPSILYLIINNYIPMLGLVIAFKKVNYTTGILESPWCGIDNFRFLFKTSDAWIITRNTLCYNACFIVLNTIMAVFIAILLNEILSKRHKSFLQGAILLPYMLSWVVIAYVVYALLAGDGGFINGIREALGQSAISWYTESKYWPFILTIVNMWKEYGYLTILYFATVVGIDSSLYEAACVDGATKLEQIRYITLPSLKPTVTIMVLMSIGRICYSDFGLFYQVPMNVGALIDATNTIDTYVYRALVQLGDIGMSSAAGFFQSIVGFVLVLTANAVTRKIDRENALY